MKSHGGKVMKPEQGPAIPTATTAPAFAEIQRTRQQLAAALERAERDYRTLVENAVEGVFRTTPDGRFIMANLALANMLGYDSPDQLIRERADLEHQHYVHPEERARFRRLVEAQGLVRAHAAPGVANLRRGSESPARHPADLRELQAHSGRRG